MLNLSSYLEKFKQFKHPSDEKDKIAKLILESTFIEVTPSEIQLKGQTLYLNVSSAAKAELFMRKEELLQVFKERLDKQITDIR